MVIVVIVAIGVIGGIVAIEVIVAIVFFGGDVVGLFSRRGRLRTRTETL